MMAYYKVNFYALNLDSLRHGPDLHQVLSPLAFGIKKSQEFLDEIAKNSSNDPMYVDAMADEQTYIEESLLGAAFVVCQASITAVVSEVKKLHARYQRNANKDLATTDGKKESIMRLGNPIKRKIGYSKIEIMNAFANYFKHQTEWSSWTRASGIAKGTIAVISAAGAKDGMSRNMLQGAKAVGNSSGHDLTIFVKLLDDWRSAVSRKYETELKKRHLITLNPKSSIIR